MISNRPRDSIDNLQSAIMHGGETAFDLVPTCLANVLIERQWEGRSDKDGNYFRSFEEFVGYKLWWGLESSIDDLLAFCRKRDDVRKLILAEVGALPAHGTNQHAEAGVDNINSSGNGGTSATYALRRLKRDRPDLAERVVFGELSANAAAIEAGFRRKTIAVPAEPDSAVRSLVRRFGLAEIRASLDRIQDEIK